MTGVISSFGDALPYAGSLLFGLDGSGTGGLCLNILITLAVLPASLVLGSLLGAVRLFRVRPLNWLAFLFIEAVKGIPVLLMIFWLHYALPAFLGLRPPLFLTAVAALTMYGSANVAEVFLSGADMVRKSELEAARLSGFSGAGVFRRVLAPQVLRRMVPALLGVMVSLFKDTSIVFVIGLIELTQTGMILANRYPDMLVPMYVLIGAGYMTVSLLLAELARVIARRQAEKFPETM